MKILFVSMPSIHAIRWIENLKETNHELFWFDVLDRGKLNTEVYIHQFLEWKQRKKPYLKGEYFISKKFPDLYDKIIPFLEVSVSEALDEIITKIEPDVIHSFEMQSCSYPILATMNKYSKITWIYSCWGSDLFFYKDIPFHFDRIKKVLKRVNYIHTDCERDFFLAKKLGFKGVYLGVIPGGTGYNIEKLKKLRQPIEDRKIILLKGYQHIFGRALTVIKALENIQEKIKNFEVIVFGAHQPIIDYVEESKLPFKVFNINSLEHEEVLELMGKSLLYIGNNISDGLPNTLLEAIVMGAFPIQSNPGGASAEIIVDSENGYLIEEPENIKEIQNFILSAIDNFDLLKKAQVLNYNITASRLDSDFNKNKVVEIYSTIQ